ncbi:unnamed protein product [Linum trigynum]|uniref:Uncharacterized protein n=1 Tax=Linum trigynum TaxID=586398 RepID=A0AAV2F776_9ROSI
MVHRVSPVGRIRLRLKTSRAAEEGFCHCPGGGGPSGGRGMAEELGGGSAATPATGVWEARRTRVEADWGGRVLQRRRHGVVKEAESRVATRRFGEGEAAGELRSEKQVGLEAWRGR